MYIIIFFFRYENLTLDSNNINHRSVSCGTSYPMSKSTNSLRFYNYNTWETDKKH